MLKDYAKPPLIGRRSLNHRIGFCYLHGHWLFNQHMAASSQAIYRHSRMERRRGENNDDIWMDPAEHITVIFIKSTAKLPTALSADNRVDIRNRDKLYTRQCKGWTMPVKYSCGYPNKCITKMILLCKFHECRLLLFRIELNKMKVMIDINGKLLAHHLCERSHLSIDSHLQKKQGDHASSRAEKQFQHEKE